MKHNECLNFASVDAAKGICRVSGEVVFIDSDSCTYFEKLPKCMHCKFFENQDNNHIGTCKGLDQEAWTFGDLTATTCKGYEEK